MNLFAILLSVVFTCVNLACAEENKSENCLLYNIITNQGKLEKELASVKENVKTLEVDNEKLRRAQDDTVQQIQTLQQNKAKNVVAFNSYRATPKNYTNGQVVVFPRVLLNKGNGYNAHTGYFTAPVTGLYIFSANICQTKKFVMVISIFHMKQRIAATTDRTDTSSTCSSVSAPAFVKKGEYVFVQSTWWNNGMFADGGHRWPSFSGVLIESF